MTRAEAVAIIEAYEGLVRLVTGQTHQMGYEGPLEEHMDGVCATCTERRDAEGLPYFVLLRLS